MAWITPKTDWVETDSCTYEDMNRIAGNINFLCSTSLKADYTRDDVVTLSEWRAIVRMLKIFAERWEYTIEDEPTEDATARNFNIVESLTLGLYNWYEILTNQTAAYTYVGDNLYADSEDWTRKGL